MFGSLGVAELLVILVLVLVLYGAKRLPALGRALGEGLNNFRHAVFGKTAHPCLPVSPAAPADKETLSSGKVETPAQTMRHPGSFHTEG